MSLANLEDSVKFADNAEPRCPCVLLLDTSGSMAGAAIDALNRGLRTFQAALAENSLASKRVEIAVVAFNDAVEVVQPFVTADQFEPPTLAAGGRTSMGGAIAAALDMVDAEKAKYKEFGVTYYRPWIFMITDGAPTDSVDQASARLKEDERQNRIAFFAVGVAGADVARLKQIAVREPLMLQELKFEELFVWLSNSMGRVSESRPGDQTALPAVSGWAAV
jgi:uncharacterized protein YegL